MWGVCCSASRTASRSRGLWCVLSYVRECVRECGSASVKDMAEEKEEVLVALVMVVEEEEEEEEGNSGPRRWL